VANIRRVASEGHAAISDLTTINLLLTMFETSGLLATTTEKFRTAGNPAGALAAHTPTTPTPQPGSSPSTQAAHASAGEYKLYYCWSHGLTTFSQHTSPTCNHKREGHKDTATINNTQGGSMTFRVNTNTNGNRPRSSTSTSSPAN